MEASALNHVGSHGLRGPTPLLRLQSDDRLVSLTRHGNQAAYEALVARYQSRLLAFCRHMLGSREDAEDVLQEVFAAAFSAMTADTRALNVRPWLYRIARNRALNHLRRTKAIGVDSMDVHLSDHGASTADKVHGREDFRLLMDDVRSLPESQRTALLLREIDALSYDQIAEAMETTVPSVKSLLVRARVSLAEAGEARKLSCDEVRDELGEVAEGLKRVSAPVRRHLRGCERCEGFRNELRRTNRALAAVLPVGPLLLLKKLVLAQLGTTASAGGSAAAAAGVGVSAAGAGGALSAGLSTVASKAAAGIAAAAIVTAGAVEVDHATNHRARQPATVVAAAAPAPAPAVQTAPRIVGSEPQPDAGTISEPARSRGETVADDDAASAASEPAAATTPAPAPQETSATAVLPPQEPGVVGPDGGAIAPAEQPAPTVDPPAPPAEPATRGAPATEPAPPTEPPPAPSTPADPEPAAGSDPQPGEPPPADDAAAPPVPPSENGDDQGAPPALATPPAPSPAAN